MTTAGVVRRRRERQALWAAALTNGPNELVDFVLPLWAGVALGLSATEVGVLTAVEMAVSVLVRPITGVLADRYERRSVAAVGAVLYAVSCAGYALAGSAGVAYGAAAVGGAGGALLWVAVRAMVGERLDEDSAVFPRLLSAEETGSWVAFVAGMALIGVIGFGGVFWLCAAACAVAAVALRSAPPRAVRTGVVATGGLGAVGRRLRPMLFAVAMTMAAESAVSLLLLLHLQRGFGLEVVQVAYVFLPGAIAMSAAAGHLHRYVVRFGRSRVLVAASLGSGAFAASLAWAPSPYVIAGLWVLSGLAWAAVMPVQQAVIAEASGDRVGRGMGVYESACLVGGLVGSLAAGALYDGANWPVACLVAAAMILAGAVVVPRAVRRLGVAEFPPPPEERPTDTVPPDTTPVDTAPASADAVRAETADAGNARATTTSGRPKTTAVLWTDLGKHAVLFAVVQVALAFFDLSWVRDLVTRDLGTVLLGQVPRDGVEAFLYGAGRVWVIVLVVDLGWTAYRVFKNRTA